MERTWTSVGVCLLVLAMAALAFGSEKKPKPGPLTGTWQCTAHASEGDEPFTMMLEQNKQTVTGTITTPNGGASISSGSYKKKVLEIHVDEGGPSRRPDSFSHGFHPQILNLESESPPSHHRARRGRKAQTRFTDCADSADNNRN